MPRKVAVQCSESPASIGWKVVVLGVQNIPKPMGFDMSFKVFNMLFKGLVP